MSMFTHDVVKYKKIKGAADKKKTKNVTCKQDLRQLWTKTVFVILPAL